MTSSDYASNPIDAVIRDLSREVEERVRSLVDDLQHAAGVARDEAVRETREQAVREANERLEVELDRVRAEMTEAMAAEVDRARDDAAAELGAQADQRLTAELERHRDEAERTLSAALERARGEAEAYLSAELSRAQQEADRRADEAIERASAEAYERARTDAERRIASEVNRARAEAAELIAAEVTRVRDEASRFEAEQADRIRAEARQSAAAELTTVRAEERESDLAAFDRLVRATRRLDQGRTLTEILDTLAESSAAEAARVAVMIVRSERLEGWRLLGFADVPGSGRAVQSPLAGGAVGQAVTTATTSFADPAAPAGGSGLTFAALPENRVGVASPLIVGGRVVALVYADDVAPGDHPVPAAWPEAIEILARHAARCLESITATRTTQLLSSPPAPSRGRPVSGSSFGGDVDGDARRFARIVISDLKVRNEDAVQEGRQQRDLLDRLRPEIEEARRRYEEQVPAVVSGRRLYFDQEVLRTLAEGDPRLLGY